MKDDDNDEETRLPTFDQGKMCHQCVTIIKEAPAKITLLLLYFSHKKINVKVKSRLV